MTDQIRAIIADDEPLARRGIRQMLAQYDDIVVVAETRNGRESVRALREIKPDLVFLDVEMPGLDGFEVLRTTSTNNMPAIIFVTAHDEFAVRAFDVNALDYLLKPLRQERLEQALDRVRERCRSAKAFGVSQRLSSLLAARERERSKERIVAHTSKGQLVIDSSEVDWIEAEDYYAAIHARKGRHLVRESLSSLMQRLNPAQFVRVHRSAIVNIDRVGEVRHEGAETLLILHNGSRVRVSRRRRQLTRRILYQLRD